jgi:hypothetical protein
MAHFAKVDDNNIVLEVLVIRNEDAPDETTGKQFIESIGLAGNWVQTSYNNNFRGKFAGIGDVYDSEKDEFIVPESSFVETTEQI